MASSRRGGDGDKMTRQRQILGRAMMGLPILTLSAVGLYTLSVSEAVPFARVMLDEAKVEVSRGHSVPILDDFYGLPGLDSV